MKSFFRRRKSRRFGENNEILLNNTVKYRKKLQTAITQINRTKKSVQRNLDHPDSEIHGKCHPSDFHLIFNYI
jgi:hypothetical protein